ncbi:MAG: hypothetical protein KDB10_21640, partial [Acidimicrobiales bacterium]|nr:hypothetical protein [Acidimicrobiales bacterium]
ANLPAWLNVAVHVNPITYAVHPLRDAVFVHIDASSQAVAALNPPLTWWGWVVPAVVQVGVVVAAGLAFLAIAIWEFNRAD